MWQVILFFGLSLQSIGFSDSATSHFLSPPLATREIEFQPIETVLTEHERLTGEPTHFENALRLAIERLGSVKGKSSVKKSKSKGQN